LVASDVSQDDGSNVGINIVQTVPPVNPDGTRGGRATYRWYAGDLSFQKSGNRISLVATPVEFGGSSLMPADKIKQGAKSMVGGLVILPQSAGAGSAVTRWVEDNGRGIGTANYGHQAATLQNGIRDLMLVMTKHNDHRYADGFPVEHINGEGVGVPEDSQESTGMSLNYAIEPLWFRFGLKPNAAFGNAAGGFGAVLNAEQAYSNSLAGGDPYTPVFHVLRGSDTRMHVAVPHGTSRGTTLGIHGHVWQRDPYVCPGENRLGLAGACVMGTMTAVGSKQIGENPYGFGQGAQESLTPFSHFTFHLPRPGGRSSVPGDYLFRDQAGFGNASGLWGILRVQ
jgi:hypothetical protein